MTPPKRKQSSASVQPTSRRRRVSISFRGVEPRTEQHHKAACDINNIMARYIKTGVLEHVRVHEPVYADVDETTYHESMNIVTNAKSMFEELPSQLRRHFNDDVSVFLEYCQGEGAAEGLRVLGEEYRRQALGLTEANEPQPGAEGSTSERIREAGGSESNNPGGDAVPGQDGQQASP